MSQVMEYVAVEPQVEDIGLRLLREAVAKPSPALADLVRRGFEQKLAELYELFLLVGGPAQRRNMGR
jgi:hypothetical protein